jgi:hypothetical protein
MSRDLAVGVCAVAGFALLVGVVRGWYVLDGVSLAVLLGVMALKAPMRAASGDQDSPRRSSEDDDPSA